jgi:hypothetical protein
VVAQAAPAQAAAWLLAEPQLVGEGDGRAIELRATAGQFNFRQFP